MPESTLVIKVPSKEMLFRKFVELDATPHLVRHFYPRLVTLGGTEVHPIVVVSTMLLALKDLSDMTDGVVVTALLVAIEEYFEILVEDKELLGIVLTSFNQKFE